LLLTLEIAVTDTLRTERRNPRRVARAHRVAEAAALVRQHDPVFARWAAGYGTISHSPLTQVRIRRLADLLSLRGAAGDGVQVYDLLMAADRLASAGLWLVVHQTYAQNVYLDGRELSPEDFKGTPEGHTGGSLNMIPAYVGYLASNVLAGLTRSWVMGQGHCVSAIDSVNLLVGNMTKAHADRYAVSDAGLTRFVRDFYSYQLKADGTAESPLGSHVGPHTAGGILEGGYLGFAELEYVHMALPGDRLVAFLSDGSFEEQRGPDWAPRWWRAEDSGLVAPILINNGRRIDQRTTMAQQGGIGWLVKHLKLNGFDPLVFDGTDPAAFVWAIFEMEHRLEAAGRAAARGGRYPVRLPYGIAVAPKGAGFYGAGTNLAHNLPLGSNPHTDPVAARRFNEHARHLFVPPADLTSATDLFARHGQSSRPRERDHALAVRTVTASRFPEPAYRPVAEGRGAATSASPMAAVDQGFLAVVQANPNLRPRVGNPDEMKSNRMLKTLDALKFRVTAPEPGVPEDIHGAVVTALNEEAVAAAALGNKGGINIAVTYEAFGVKMLGAVRQEIIWANHVRETGGEVGWLSVPLVLTSHTWENGKNEQSHQDPTMAEALMGEPADVSRVLFPADYNSAAAVMDAVYRTRGQIWTLVVPKADSVADVFPAEQAARLLRDGAVRLDSAGHNADRARLVVTAVGAYQLAQALRASRRLAEAGVDHSVVYMVEPSRFRRPRNRREAAHQAPAEVRERLYPASAEARVFIVHTRPEPVLGLLDPAVTGRRAVGLGFTNHGGTFDVEGLLFINRSTWAHVVDATARLLEIPRTKLLSPEEEAALDGRLAPKGVVVGTLDVKPMPG
jgi:phosphoketolase